MTRELTLLHTSAVHSRLWPFRDRVSNLDARLGLGREGELGELGGAARLATLLAEERRRGAALWVDSGDLLEGAPVFGRYRGAVEVELWGALGVSAMALGNHELALEEQELEQLFGRAPFPVLASNLVPRRGARWLTSSTVVWAGGNPIGVVGCASEGSPPSLGAADNRWGLTVVSAAAAVQAAIDELRGRASLVVLLSHQGLEADRALVRETSGIDVVLGGHQHALTVQPEWEEDCAARALKQARGCAPRRVPIVHSGAYGRYLSRVELRLRPAPAAPGALEVTSVALAHLPISEQVAEDAAIVERLEPFRASAEPPLAYLPAPVSRRSAVSGDSALGNLVTDAVRAETGADVVLLNQTGLRDDLEAGPLLAGDLALAFPFEEPWRLVWLSGSELRAGLNRAARKSAARGCETALELAGLWWRVRCAACAGEQTRCWRAGRGDTELQDDARVLVALPAYLASPGAEFEAVGARGEERHLSISEVVGRYAAAFPPVSDLHGCARALEHASPSRCAEAFGIGCPVRGERALYVCSRLPQLEGAHDGRIQMLP
jgi:5'-nucleotidase